MKALPPSWANVQFVQKAPTYTAVYADSDSRTSVHCHVCQRRLFPLDGVFEARVSKVLDGDSFTLSSESRRIRVWGLDAPEWDHAGGSAATATLKQLISGQTLRCAVLDIDRYGRLVAQCVLPNGVDIAAAMIQSGAATEYCRFSRGYYGTC